MNICEAQLYYIIYGCYVMVLNIQSSYCNNCKGLELDNCDDKAFSIHKLWLLSGGRSVSVDTEKVFWRHIIGGLLSTVLQQAGTTQQYKGKMWRSWESWVVVAQWLERWWLKPVALSSISGDNQDFSFFFLCFFPDPVKWEESFYL